MSKAKKGKLIEKDFLHKYFSNPFYLVLTFGIVIIAIPLTLTNKCIGIVDFSNTGEIGDTIGGITSPFIGALVGILTYLAFKEQIRANEINIKNFQKQIKKQKEATKLQDLYFKKQQFDATWYRRVDSVKDILQKVKILGTKIEGEKALELFFELHFLFRITTAINDKLLDYKSYYFNSIDQDALLLKNFFIESISYHKWAYKAEPMEILTHLSVPNKIIVSQMINTFNNVKELEINFPLIYNNQEEIKDKFTITHLISYQAHINNLFELVDKNIKDNVIDSAALAEYTTSLINLLGNLELSILVISYIADKDHKRFNEYYVRFLVEIINGCAYIPIEHKNYFKRLTEGYKPLLRNASE